MKEAKASGKAGGYPSRKGTPQGGIISPRLSNMTLDGLEEVVRGAVPRRNRVNFIRYADDFIVTGKSKRLLESKVQPAVERFLAERGLTLSYVFEHLWRMLRKLSRTVLRGERGCKAPDLPGIVRYYYHAH